MEQNFHGGFSYYPIYLQAGLTPGFSFSDSRKRLFFPSGAAFAFAFPAFLFPCGKNNFPERCEYE